VQPRNNEPWRHPVYGHDLQVGTVIDVHQWGYVRNGFSTLA
jgi:hypothetical protein